MCLDYHIKVWDVITFTQCICNNIIHNIVYRVNNQTIIIFSSYNVKLLIHLKCSLHINDFNNLGVLRTLTFTKYHLIFLTHKSDSHMQLQPEMRWQDPIGPLTRVLTGWHLHKTYLFQHTKFCNQKNNIQCW